jgi:hypothetical protein
MSNRTWFKIYANKWLTGSLRGQSAVTRAVFIDLLALCADGKYSDDGLLQMLPAVGYDLQTMSKITGLDWRTMKAHVDILEEIGCIKRLENNILCICNWTKYQSEYDRQKPYRKVTKEVTDIVTTEVTTPVTGKVTQEIEIEIENKKNISKDIFKEIFDFWNLKKIKPHRKLTEAMEKKIRTKLKDYTKDEILQSISNYAEILHGDEYRWDYAWTLEDFLQRGFEKFTDLKIAKNNYRHRDNENQPPAMTGPRILEA